MQDTRGILSFIEEGSNIPFKIEQTLWISGENTLNKSMGFAFKSAASFIVALTGNTNVAVSDGTIQKNYHLRDASCGLYLPEMTWCSFNSVAKDYFFLILASIIIKPEDIFYSYNTFQKQIFRHA